jgi:anti-sigma-K factor RskA
MTIDLHSFTAPYALDALDELERARFEAHLESCADCRAEVAGFVATTGRIGESLRQAPPPLVRERLMTEIADTPQQRRTRIETPGRLRRAIPRVAVAAAVLVGGFGIGGYVVEHQRAEDLSGTNVAISSVLGAPDADTSTKVFDGGGTMRMVSSVSNDSAVVVVHDLDAPPADRVYQLWMIDDAGPHSQGTFTTSDTMIMHGLASADRIAVTIEPAGGSTQPTTPPIATLAV